MSHDSIDVRTELAASRQTRVEIGADGVLHVLAGYVTLHLQREVCAELATTLAKAMVALSRAEPKPGARLTLVRGAGASPRGARLEVPARPELGLSGAAERVRSPQEKSDDQPR